MKPFRTGDKAKNLKPALTRLGIVGMTYLTLAVFLLLGVTPEQHDIRVGLPAAMDILATKDVRDTVTTEQKKEAAAAQVEPSYKSADAGVTAEVMSGLDNRFSALSDALSGLTADSVRNMSEQDFEALNTGLGLALTR
ncbi:MAG: hypothetical protein ACSW8J_10490, partial [bacterium]